MLDMNLSVFAQRRLVAHIFRERDQYVLQYASGVASADFVGLTMPVQASPWLWPRDLHPGFPAKHCSTSSPLD